jgi:hypothetical protein
VLALPLDLVRGLLQILDRRPEVVLDLLVGRDARRDGGGPTPADELVVDLPGRGDRALDVLADFLVLQGALHVRRRVGDPVLRFGHLGRPFVSVSRLPLIPEARGLQTPMPV